MIYIYIFFPFSLFVSVYASLCEFVCIALLLPFVLGFCLFFFNLKNLFFLIFFIFYFNYFILFYFILSSSFFFSPFYSEPCGGQVLGAPARVRAVTEVGEPSSGHWSTRDLPAPHNIKRRKSPRDLHLNAKTQLHSPTSKLQCRTPYAKQLARQEHKPTH